MAIHEYGPNLLQAKKLIEQGDDNSLRYACLELRHCFEIIAYRQLQQYGDALPGNIIGEWKPDQIVKMLASFDPITSQAGRLSIAAHDANGQPGEWRDLGETKVIPWRKFRVFYNKLGSYLHATPPEGFGKARKPLTAESLQEIMESLEHVLSATIVLAVKNIISAKCKCGTLMHIGEDEFSTPDVVICSNRKCNSIWAKAVTENNEKVLEPIDSIVFKCPCEATTPIPYDQIWRPFTCRNCSKKYKLNLGYCRALEYEDSDDEGRSSAEP